MLADIAFISVDLPRDEDTAETQLADAIKEYGRVISHAPVQITLAEERPGAILVQWMEVFIHSRSYRNLDYLSFREMMTVVLI